MIWILRYFDPWILRIFEFPRVGYWDLFNLGFRVLALFSSLLVRFWVVLGTI